MTFFNIWNILVGTIKGNKNLQLQRISRVSKLCLLNAALTGVQKTTENKVCLCGCFIYLFKLKVVRFFYSWASCQIHSFLRVGFLTHIAELDTSAMEDFFCLDPGGKEMFSATLISAPEW